jgi:hypothetical protein
MSRPTSLGEHPTPWEAMVRLRHQAQRLNRLYGITGALLVSPHWFLQTLEGEPTSVYATLARINLDLRHQDLRIFEASPAPHRLFAVSTMHVRPADEVNPNLIEQCTEVFLGSRPYGAWFLLRALQESVETA